MATTELATQIAKFKKQGTKQLETRINKLEVGSVEYKACKMVIETRRRADSLKEKKAEKTTSPKAETKTATPKKEKAPKAPKAEKVTKEKKEPKPRKKAEPTTPVRDEIPKGQLVGFTVAPNNKRTQGDYVGTIAGKRFCAPSDGKWYYRIKVEGFDHTFYKHESRIAILSRAEGSDVTVVVEPAMETEEDGQE